MNPVFFFEIHATFSQVNYVMDDKLIRGSIAIGHEVLCILPVLLRELKNHSKREFSIRT